MTLGLSVQRLFLSALFARELLASQQTGGHVMTKKDVAKFAVEMADALLEELTSREGHAGRAGPSPADIRKDVP
jgi:hypothetical protein